MRETDFQQALAKLTEKLGASGERLFRELVNYAPVHAVLCLMLLPMFLVSLCVALHMATKIDWDKEFGKGLSVSVLFAVSIITGIALAVNASSIVQALFCPEVWALQRLLH